MTGERLSAVVIGAGQAGEGQTRALLHIGVDVVAICARQADVVRSVAEDLGVAEASTDWRSTLKRLRPDIVALATPAALRREPIELACELGAHVFCEKPLAVDVAEARDLYSLVEQAGVKHAFATIWTYNPATVWLAELVKTGAIGTLREVQLAQRANLFAVMPLAPWSWWDSLALGGGTLANDFIHHLPVLERISGGRITRVVGTTRRGRERAPYVPAIRDLRQVFAARLTPEEAARLDWRASDVDMEVRALLQVASPAQGGAPIDAAMVCTILADALPDGNGWRFHGDIGTLVAPGDAYLASLREVLLYRPGRAEPERLPVPERLLDQVPRVGKPMHNLWAALLRDFVADIRGEPHGPYPTLHDGWRYQVAIDAIRAGRGWEELPR